MQLNSGLANCGSRAKINGPISGCSLGMGYLSCRCVASSVRVLGMRSDRKTISYEKRKLK